ncbi:histone deacetylase family protein [Epibacterium sp. SM1979]|uniref:Histone deacetylase family protein n=1 Tax=Tritonibacter litoralis TaxID=2662264 RepID=A0A843YIH6_9RHOB|nr:histone deacetylase family protein [Tritonibacter litoralis]MQQ09072.1 histone deacetylase family protein [Tritonibacter litoralis]
MKCFYAPETEQHNPQFRLTHGRPSSNAELPKRAELLLAGLKQMGFETTEPPQAPRSAYEAVHTPELLAFLETGWEAWQKLPGASEEIIPNLSPDKNIATYPDSILGRAGWHMGDASAPVGPHSWNATCRAADCAVAAADAVADGAPVAYALTRPPGHHSSADVVAGHCLMNISAIAVERLRQTKPRVATLDIDVHHGNGTQAIFYDRDDVLTVSIHADPSDYYPFYVGHAHETGNGAGDGFNLNLPLPRTTSDDVWMAAVTQGLERIAAFEPDVLVVPLGLDAHENDPLDGMQVSWDGFRRAGAAIAATGLPTVLIQEGGYLSDDLTTSLVSFLSGMLDRA